MAGLIYPNYSDDERAQMMQQYGHELVKKHPASDPNQLGYQIAADQGISPDQVRFRFQSPDNPNEIGNARFEAGQPALVTAYPFSNSDSFAGNLGHEIGHVAEKQAGESISSSNPNRTEANSNSGQHFGSDYPGQMMTYEGKQALDLMGQRLNDQNFGIQSGLVQDNQKKQAVSDLLKKKQADFYGQ